jgi:plastocyanin
MRSNLMFKLAPIGIAAALALPMTAWSASHTINVGQTAGGGQGNSFNDPTTNTNVTNAAVGDTITFTNVGASPGFHNVRSDGPVTTFRCANGCDGVGGGSGDPSSTNWTATITLATADTIHYYCEIHGAPSQGMSGTINVTTPVELQTFEVD